MKQIGIHILSFLMALLLSCENRREQSKECELGKEQAREDIKSNSLGLYFFGMPSPKFNLRIKIVSEKLNVKVKGGGDIVTEEGTCYNNVMEEQIKKIYGDDIFKTIDASIDSLYSNGVGDREASFKDGIAGLNQIIFCNLNFFDVKSSDTDKPSVYIDFSISEKGTVEEFKVRKGFSKKLDEEALRVASMLKDWMPAIENSVPVRSKFTIRIHFDPLKKENFSCK